MHASPIVSWVVLITLVINLFTPGSAVATASTEPQLGVLPVTQSRVQPEARERAFSSVHQSDGLFYDDADSGVIYTGAWERNICDADLSVIPDWIFRLEKLQKLDVSGMILTHLPEWLLAMPHLEDLNCSDNTGLVLEP